MHAHVRIGDLAVVGVSGKLASAVKVSTRSRIFRKGRRVTSNLLRARFGKLWSETVCEFDHIVRR